MAATATRTLEEMRDIVSNDMPQIYDRTAGVDDVNEVLELEAAMEMECERREMDARAMIRGANYMCHVATICERERVPPHFERWLVARLLQPTSN